jgi:inosine/xanthosine triphosphatase
MQMPHATTPPTLPPMHTIRTVAVGSRNPVKVAAVRAVMARIDPAIEVVEIEVASGVRDQPWGDEETQLGAENRARATLIHTGADLGLGIEGGVVETSNGQLRSCAWAVAVDRQDRVGIGGSLAIPLPHIVAQRLRDGEELGHAMDAVARTVGTKHGRGAVGILTASLIDRQRAYEPLVTYALAPWLASEFFAQD